LPSCFSMADLLQDDSALMPSTVPGAPLLESARRGIYRDTAFRSHDLGFRDRPLHLDQGTAIVVGDEVKGGRFHFQTGNLVDPDLLSAHPRV